MSTSFLPYGRQEITQDDVDAVVRVLRADLITQGPQVESFEAAVAEYLGARHVVTFSSGTAALHGAAFAAGLGPGDQGLTSPLTFVASANCILYQGAEVRFVDVSPDTWNLDIAAAAHEVAEHTRCVLPVSFAGLPVELEPLDPVRDRVVVIEDAAHALGARRNGSRVGGPGGADMTVFSLHPVKVVTSGEGGLVATEDDGYAARLRLFRTHGITKEGLTLPPDAGDWYYDMKALGFNYRITDFQCALGQSQLERLDDYVAARNRIASRYRDLLADQPLIGLPPSAPEGSLHAYHLFIVRVLAGAAARQRVFATLRAANIGVQVHYIPVYRLSYYRSDLGMPQDECPAAEDFYAGAISLPIFPGMTDGDVDRVVRELAGALQ